MDAILCLEFTVGGLSPARVLYRTIIISISRIFYWPLPHLKDARLDGAFVYYLGICSANLMVLWLQRTCTSTSSRNYYYSTIAVRVAVLLLVTSHFMPAPPVAGSRLGFKDAKCEHTRYSSPPSFLLSRFCLRFILPVADPCTSRHSFVRCAEWLHNSQIADCQPPEAYRRLSRSYNIEALPDLLRTRRPTLLASKIYTVYLLLTIERSPASCPPH